MIMRSKKNARQEFRKIWILADFRSPVLVVPKFSGELGLDLVKHLIIKISERSFTQRFGDSMSSFSSERE